MRHQKEFKSWLTSRRALNIYFWLGFIFFPLVLSLGNHEHDQPNVRAQFFFSLFYSCIIYWNILWLMPRLFQKGKFPIYFMLLVLTIGLWSVFQVRYDYLFYGCNCQHPLTFTTFTTAFFQITSFVVVFAAAKLVRDAVEREEAIKIIERQQIELEKERVESELSFLKDQVNPHFLFNTLNTLYSFALEKSPLIPDYILKLSGIMRYMLYESDAKFVALEREIQYLENYIDLQEIRLSGRGDISLKVEGDYLNQRIAPLMLITFVENCFKHSMAANTDKIHIEIELNISDETLIFSAVNNYQIHFKEKDEPGGIGLENVKKRLELLYPNAHELLIKPGKERFSIQLNLKLST